MKKIFVWDLPLRLFHWALVILVAVSFYTGLTGGLTLMDYHLLSGYSILVLLIFRVGWGFLGSHHARFYVFVPGPRALFQATRQLFDRQSAPYTGHNPLGGISVLALITALLVQAGTGLFADDDIFTAGPLTHLVSNATSARLTEIHKTNMWVIGILIGLHLMAVTFYELYKGQRLVVPMITGKKVVPIDARQTQSVNNRLVMGVVLLAVSATIVYWLINYV